MATYYRIQELGFTWEQTLTHQSRNWGELDHDTHQPLGGICACDDSDELVTLINDWFPGGEYLDQHEVLVFEGIPIRNVGDGWIVEPQYQIERMTTEEFLERYT